MENDILHKPASSVYPGSYVPMLEQEELRRALNRPHNHELILPSVKISEMTDSYKVDLNIPGIEKQDLYITACENDLYICVVHTEAEDSEMKNRYIAHINYDCSDRHIVLPENADTAFITAEYKAGVLHLFVSKSVVPVINQPVQIAVY